MTRIPLVSGRDALSPEGQAVYDQTSAERYGEVLPHNLLLLRDPRVARIMLELGTHVGIGSNLPFLEKEIMAVSAYTAAGCGYAAELHIRIAEQRGLPAAAAAELRRGDTPNSTTAQQRLLVAFAVEAVVERAVSEETFQAVLAEYGEDVLFQVTMYLGYIAFTSVVLNALGLTAADLP
jgi:4-carboxymuconolactone decarboxylase